MPRLSLWFIRFSLAYLALGFTFGALMLANKGMAFAPWLAILVPAHSEILLIGWLVQLALGVAYWILPRFTRGMPRGNPATAWLSLYSVNAGIIMAAVGESSNIPLLVLPARVLEAISVMAFLLLAWGRIRASS